MNLTIELPDDVGMALHAKAIAQGVSPDRFVSRILETTFAGETAPSTVGQPFETGYGTWAKYGVAPSAEEFEENRREMFSSFGSKF